MPVRYFVTEEILVVAVEGAYTSEELRRVGDAALRAPGSPHPAPVLLDMSKATGLGARSGPQLRATAAFFARRARWIRKIAIVAPSDLVFGLMRMGATFGDTMGLVVGVFRTHDEAMEFLGEGAAPPPARGPLLQSRRPDREDPCS